MSWTTVLWAMGASACLTLAAIHLGVGLRQRAAANLLFSLSAVSAAAIAVFEQLLMKSPSPAAHGQLLRWAQVPVLSMVVGLVLFVRAYLRAGRSWLAWAAIGSRALAVAVNFFVPLNLNYTSITGVRPIPWLGDTVYVTVGILSRWTLVGRAASILLVLFAADAAWTVWRRGDRERALLVGGSILFFVSFAVTHTALVQREVLHSPYVISLAYLGIVAAMAYELTFDVVRASELSRRLQSSEGALRESDRRMSFAADAASVYFWQYDVADDEVWLSEAARDFRGYGKDERVSLRRFVESVHMEDQEGLRAGIEAAIRTGARLEREYRITLPSGVTRWIVSRGRLESGPDGGPRLSGVSVDVTDRRMAEHELERNRLDLAHLSRVTVLGELSGSLAHEINQPLTAILSNAQAALRFLSRDGGNLDEVREILSDIVAEDRHAGEVIRRLRLLLKKGEVEFQPLDLSEVVRDALGLVRSNVLDKGVTVSVDLPPDLPRAVGDRIQIQQVVVNLVTNACDAMESRPAGRRHLSVLAAETGAGLLVSIADTGPGISAEQAARLFEPFFTTKTAGLGLGLAVCRTIVSAHGGDLWATTNPDRGATFHFTLRMSPAPGLEARA